MGKLLRYLKNYKKETVLAPLFKLFEATLELFVPLVMKAIIDNGIGNKDINYIIKMCLVLFLLAAVGLAFSITAQFFAARAAVGFVKDVRHDLFSHIEDLSYSKLDEIGTSTLITRMTSDVNQVQSGVNMTLRLLLRSPFIVFGAMIMAFTIDVKAAFIFVVTIPALSLVVFGIMVVSIPLFKKVQGALDVVLSITRENLTGVRVIRAFCKEQSEIDEFENKNSYLTYIQKYVGRISALLNPVTYVIINVAVVILIWTGAIRVSYGILTQGAVVALYNYMSQILEELIKLANLIVNITKSVACGNRIQSAFEIQSGMEEVVEKGNKPNVASNEDKGVVEFIGVTKKYHSEAEAALINISFKAESGETIGIIGGTGSGKSTLVNLIPRFYDVTQGEVLVDNKDVREYSLKDIRSKIGVVPQKAVLFKGTIRDNIKWGNEDATDKEILEALEIARAKDFVMEKEGGLDFMIFQGGKNLSGGQKQRLTIARAIVRKPEVLILDDSASALDLATDAALRRALKEMSYKPTTFIVSQRTSSIMTADRIIVLDEGEAVGMGTHDELLKSCETYREIFESQYGKEAANE